MWMEEKHLSQTQNTCCSWKNISHTAKNNKLSLHDSKHQSSDRQKYPTVPRDPQSLVHLNPSRSSKNQKHLMVHSECPHLSPLQRPRKSVGSWRRMGWHLSFSELGGGFSLEMVMALRRQHHGKGQMWLSSKFLHPEKHQGMWSLLWWPFSSERKMLLPLRGH